MSEPGRYIVTSTKFRFAALLAVALSWLALPWFAIAADDGYPPPGECPQPRFTGKAPPDIYPLTNPLPATPATLAAGQQLYRGKSGATACTTCHGIKGDGKGALASQFAPPPRNFACAQTIKGIPDGQLFWIVRNGSPGTAMSPASALGKFTDENIWQIVAYLRTFPR
jgi:mono/diheme cytochrome c family protein